MSGIFRGKKGALMVVEPPGELRIARVLEIDDGVLVAVEKAVFENLRGPVSHARISEIRPGIECAPNEAAEERCGGGAVETVVVIEDSYEHARVF